MTGKKKIQKHAGKAPPAAPESAPQPDEAPAGAASEEEDEFAFLRPTETLRKQLLREELKLRKIQPEAWTRIKYRKSVKLPKDLFKKSRGQKRCSITSKLATTSIVFFLNFTCSNCFSITSSPLCLQDSASEGVGSIAMTRSKSLRFFTSSQKVPNPAPTSINAPASILYRLQALANNFTLGTNILLRLLFSEAEKICLFQYL